MRFENQGFDHVEFVVKDLAAHVRMYQTLGFECVGSREIETRGIRSKLMAQGRTRVLLTSPISPESAQRDRGAAFFEKHGDGIAVLAVEVSDVRTCFNAAIERGARPAQEPIEYSSNSHGSVLRAEIWTPADVRYAFIQRTTPTQGPTLFDEGLVVDRLESPAPLAIWSIDHLTNNVGMGEMKTWVDFYQRVFDFEVTRHFHIQTGRTGLISDVVQSRDRKITVPINEATEPESQVQEFVERFKGPGVQHLALLTTDIRHTVKELGKRGVRFLSVPSTYYEAIPNRVKGVKEPLSELEDLQILVDGEREGYLLQIFTEEVVGPFFFEFIQRKGDNGFGEGNFRALFEAIERDQVRRGVLTNTSS